MVKSTLLLSHQKASTPSLSSPLPLRPQNSIGNIPETLLSPGVLPDSLHLAMVPLMYLLRPYCTHSLVQGKQMVATVVEHTAPPCWVIGLLAPINYIMPVQLETT